MSNEAGETFHALVAIAWSRVWSPVVPQDAVAAAWQALGLPDDEALRDTEFCSTFHAGFPAPRVSLLLHDALDQPGDHVRIDFLRAMAHLGVQAGPKMLPPDHLAVACEITACAVSADEPVIVTEIRDRYLLPWCARAEIRLAEDGTGSFEIVREFRSFAGSLAGHPAYAASHEMAHFRDNLRSHLT